MISFNFIPTMVLGVSIIIPFLRTRKLRPTEFEQLALRPRKLVVELDSNPDQADPQGLGTTWVW